MTLRQEIIEYVNIISEEQLAIVKPILQLMMQEPLIIEGDLTQEEKDIAKKGMEEYRNGKYIHMTMDEFLKL